MASHRGSNASQALASAEISFDHAQVIERTLAALPAHLIADHHEALERDLVQHARVLDPDALRTPCSSPPRTPRRARAGSGSCAPS
ncbi:hypothetical protein GCM10023175_25190 [Pseudonocardia xishanensis]|uniref:DUF222 domain-containing protein n=1 Tax=Pseudonocardia xishanensis TaxID=630995 RepID=A0ABP8RQV9_9PSEU